MEDSQTLIYKEANTRAISKWSKLSDKFCTVVQVLRPSKEDDCNFDAHLEEM